MSPKVLQVGDEVQIGVPFTDLVATGFIKEIEVGNDPMQKPGEPREHGVIRLTVFVNEKT